MIEVRQVTDEDLPMLEQWAQDRGCVLPLGLLSPHGWLAVNGDGQAVMCAFSALMFEVPIVQVDHVYLPRRFKADEAREAWRSILAAIRVWVQLLNQGGGLKYTVIEIVMNPVMEREVVATGGQVSASNYKKCHYLVGEEGA